MIFFVVEETGKAVPVDVKILPFERAKELPVDDRVFPSELAKELKRPPFVSIWSTDKRWWHDEDCHRFEICVWAKNKEEKDQLLEQIMLKCDGSDAVTLHRDNFCIKLEVIREKI